MGPQPQNVKSVSRTVTIGAPDVSMRDTLSYSRLTRLASGLLRTQLWPVMVIAVATVSSVLWTVFLLWLVGRVFW